MILFVYLFVRLWGTPPPFSRDCFFDDFSPSFLEADVAAEVEWSVSISLLNYVYFVRLVNM